MGCTDVMCEATGQHLDIVRLLLHARANSNHETDDFSPKSALRLAAEKGCADIVECLLLANAPRPDAHFPSQQVYCNMST